MYENQYVLINNPDNKHIKNVWDKIIKPIDKGWFKKIIIIEIISMNVDKNIFVISKNSLIKIIILEIIDKDFLFLWSF